MIKTILAVIGVVYIICLTIKFVVRFALRVKHADDMAFYEIYDENNNVIWKSGLVDEFTSAESAAFASFCNEWAKHPGATAKWDRVSNK